MTEQFCHWAMAGMGGVIVAMAGYIVKLHLEIKALWEARVKALEAQIAALTAEEE